MNLIQRLLGRRPPEAATTLPAFTSRDGTRREIVAMAVRDTLRRHGIPPAWIAAEAGPALTVRRERGIHLRLMVRHWHPALASCMVALQKSVTVRLLRLDPLSCEWLVGVSWKFELMDDSMCPALPAADYWRQVQAPAVVPTLRHQVAPARQALQRLMSDGDQAFAAQAPDGFSPTQPMLHA